MKYDRLRELIVSEYGSVYAFASLLGLSSNSVYDILNGKYYPRVKHFMKMCELLDVKPWTMYDFYLPLEDV